MELAQIIKDANEDFRFLDDNTMGPFIKQVTHARLLAFGFLVDHSMWSCIQQAKLSSPNLSPGPNLSVPGRNLRRVRVRIRVGVGIGVRVRVRVGVKVSIHPAGGANAT